MVNRRRRTSRIIKHSLRASISSYRNCNKASPILVRKKDPSPMHRMRYPTRLKNDFLRSPICCSSIARLRVRLEDDNIGVLKVLNNVRPAFLRARLRTKDLEDKLKSFPYLESASKFYTVDYSSIHENLKWAIGGVDEEAACDLGGWRILVHRGPWKPRCSAMEIWLDRGGTK